MSLEQRQAHNAKKHQLNNIYSMLFGLRSQEKCGEIHL